MGLGGNVAQYKGSAWPVFDLQQYRRGGAFGAGLGQGRAPLVPNKRLLRMFQLPFLNVETQSEVH